MHDDPKDNDIGHICKVCDRKFFIKDILIVKQGEIARNYQLISGEKGK